MFFGLRSVIMAAVAALIVGGLGGGAGAAAVAWKIQDGNIAKIEKRYAREKAEAVRQARIEERQAAKITAKAERDSIAAQEVIRWRTKTLVKEVPVYVSAESDARCVVPVGAVRLFNAAAAGVSVDQVPGPAGLADDEGSGVALSGMVEAAAENAGAYHQVADQLTRLQAWVTAQKALADSKTEGVNADSP